MPPSRFWSSGAARFSAHLRETAWVYLVAPVFLGGLVSFATPEGSSLPSEIGLFAAIIWPVSLVITAGRAFLIAPLARGRARVRQVCELVWTVFVIWAGVEVAVRVFQFAGVFAASEERRTSALVLGLFIGLALITVITIRSRARDERESSRRTVAELRHECTKARLSALRARTNPHFLYNCLNTVACLIEEAPAEAGRALERLSDLYRYTLEGSERAEVSLVREIAATQDYLALEALRFGDRLRVELSVGEGLARRVVPPLTLQPVVENAVKHGIGSRVERGVIRIVIRERWGKLVMIVEDDGPGPGGSTHVGTRTGVADLRERLRLLYGAQAGVELETLDGGGARVSISLPLRSDAGGSTRAGARPR